MSIDKFVSRIEYGYGKSLSIGDGWLPLVSSLDDSLAEIDPDYSLGQCKEKFGGLRYYAIPSENLDDSSRRKFHDLISDAEKRSYTICEVCGGPGRPTNTYTIRTVCPDHE